MKIGYCYVVGDIIHRGHIEFLKRCRKLCDILICGVLTNEAVMERKPKPIISFEERIIVVSSIKYIHVVVPQTTYSPLGNCKRYFPDILFESTSHKPTHALGYMKKHGKKVIVFPYYERQSSTKIKWKVKKEVH